MALVDFNWNPTTRQLRQFGGLCLVALPLFGWIWGAGPLVETVLAGCGAVVAAFSWIAPRLVSPLFIGISLVTTPIGRVLGELALLVIYFCVFLPVGILFRLANRDALGLRQRKDVTTYWRPKHRTADVASYYRQS